MELKDKRTEKEVSFKPAFIQIDFQITAKCNAKCMFCQCWRDSANLAAKDLPGEKWIESAQKLKDFTNVDLVCIGGGEPLLYPHLFQVLKGLRRLEIPSVVVTNGSLFSEENCKKIIDSGVGHIDFSLDSFSGKHNRMRGFPGLFEKCCEAMDTLKRISPKISLGVSTLICGENISELPEFTEWSLGNLPIDAINFQAYNQVVDYSGNNWWEKSPLWPKNRETVIRVMDCLIKKGEEGARIANNPIQLEKFKRYFLNPESKLNIKCPAGAFNFSVSHQGNIIGCIAESPLGNIKESNPVDVYKQKFGNIRQKASQCKENCHFLINCYFPLHWKRWNSIVKDMVKEGEEDYKPGKVILPPEIKEITSVPVEGYPDLINHKDYSHLDSIGKYKDSFENRRMPSTPEGLPQIYLCGDSSEVHRWGVDLEENDFFKQLDKLKQLSREKLVYHTVVGVRRTNFYRLGKIYNLIRRAKEEKEVDFPKFKIKPFKGVKERFYRYLTVINSFAKKEGVEFRITDKRLDQLLGIIEESQKQKGLEENDFWRALGPVCKDAFIGPRFILLDLAGRCNLDCVYCRRFSPWNKEYWRKQHPELSGFIDFEVVKNVLLDAKEMGVETVLLVGGGEPTLHPKFKEIIELISKLGMKFNFSTNGVLLGLYNNYLVDGHCDSVTVSLSFASKKSFSSIRPTSNSKVMKNIEKNVKKLAKLKASRKAAYPGIIALYAICKYNYKEILKMVAQAKKIGADTIWFQLTHLEDFSRDKLYIEAKEMEKVKELLSRAKALAQKKGLSFNSFIEFEMNHYDQKRGDWSKKGLLKQGCFVGWHFSFIHLRQEVFMCCGAKTVGILDKGGRGFKDLWFSDAYRRYRNDGLIMHRENPLTIYGKPLYEKYCDSCDNHDQNTKMLKLIKKYKLAEFVQR
jgi:MoaA/NifB/PqqE/SkfB family radical SAM enzyme